MFDLEMHEVLPLLIGPIAFILTALIVRTFDQGCPTTQGILVNAVIQLAMVKVYLLFIRS